MSLEQDAYKQIIACLKELESHTLEIEILSSALCPPGPPKVVQEEQAIGIPKALLIPAFKHALSVLALGKPQDPAAVPTIEQRLEATVVVLLVAPEHLTTANIRKRNLLALYEAVSSTPDANDTTTSIRTQDFSIALQTEVNFLDSLLTSPLHKHAKSPTLWSHRRWLVMNFLLNTPHQPHTFTISEPTEMSSKVSPSHSGPQNSRTADVENDQTRLLLNEFDIVSRAALQHPRNYPAFDYLRRLITYFKAPFRSDTAPSAGLDDTLLTIRQKAHMLALRNPSDTSIWGFWQFLSTTTLSHNEDSGFESNATSAIVETLEMALRLRWRGEAVWGCLRIALASEEVAGIGEEERRHGVQIIQDWLVQLKNKSERDEQDSVVARDLEQLESIVGRAVKWIDLNWKSSS